MFRCYDSLPGYPVDRMHFATGLKSYLTDKVAILTFKNGCIISSYVLIRMLSPCRRQGNCTATFLLKM